MKKISTKTTTARKTTTTSHRSAGLAEMNKVSRMEFERADMERLEQERIDYATNARKENTFQQAGMVTTDARGWMDIK